MPDGHSTVTGASRQRHHAEKVLRSRHPKEINQRLLSEWQIGSGCVGENDRVCQPLNRTRPFASSESWPRLAPTGLTRVIESPPGTCYR